jgi:EpsI family protein
VKALASNRIALTVGSLMLAASLGAIVVRPTEKLSDLTPSISLETMIPRKFGEWTETPTPLLQVVNPQQQELLDKSYSQVLSRNYVNDSGYRIMLSIAYGDNQRERAAHLPEVCYPAQGFVIESNEAARLVTPMGEIPVRRLFATTGMRKEPLTYWFAVGGTAIQGKLEMRLALLRHGLGGQVPDGLLFRVSSIDSDQARAYRLQDQFVVELLHAVSPAERARMSGLGAP